MPYEFFTIPRCPFASAEPLILLLLLLLLEGNARIYTPGRLVPVTLGPWRAKFIAAGADTFFFFTI